MPSSTIPAPLPAWSKTLHRLLPGVSSYLDSLVTYLVPKSSPSDMIWMRLAVKFDNLANATRADDFYCTFDLSNITGGALDTTWTTTDFTTCESKFDTFFNDWITYMDNQCRVTEYRWYQMQFNNYGVTEPFQQTGPPVRVTSKSFTGTMATVQAPQVAMTVTEKTAFPKNWGRFYLPVPSASQLDVTRQFKNATVDAVATITQTLYSTLMAADFQPTVPITQTHKDPNRQLLTVNQIQVDSVPDVQRRRRPFAPLYKKALP